MMPDMGRDSPGGFGLDAGVADVVEYNRFERKSYERRSGIAEYRTDFSPRA